MFRQFKSWPTELRPRAPSGGRTSALPPQVRPSRPRRCHAPIRSPVCFAVRALPRQSSLNRAQRRSALPPRACRHPARSPLCQCSLQLAHDSIFFLRSLSTSPLSRRVKVDAVFLLLHSGAPLLPESELSSPWPTTTRALSLLSLPSLSFPANPRCSCQA